MRSSRRHDWQHKPKRSATRTAVAIAAGFSLLAACGVSDEESGDDKVDLGFIVPTLNNPYYGAMRQAAEEAAKAKGVELHFMAGENEGDVAPQIEAIENLTTRRVDVIAIVPTDSAAVVPALERAREAGIKVLAVDTNVEPVSAADSYVGTDNYQAGLLSGQWSAKAIGTSDPIVALVGLLPGNQVSQERLDGFLEGFGMEASDAAVQLDTKGAQAPSQQGMEDALVKRTDYNLIWSLTEPAGYGVVSALQARGLAGKIPVVTIDGSCRGVEAVRDGEIAANVMQFPAVMAEKAVDMAMEAAAGNELPKSVDTGEKLIVNDPMPGVPSESPEWGIEHCWG